MRTKFCTVLAEIFGVIDVFCQSWYSTN